MEIDGNTYLIKSRFTEDSYEVMLTDLTAVWLEQLAEGALKKRIKARLKRYLYLPLR